MTKKRVLMVAVLGVLVVAAPGLWKRCFGEPVVYGALVDRTEPQVNRWYGSPVKDWSGYEQLGDEGEPTHLPPEPIRTVIYRPRGLLHLQGGTLWVWYSQRGGEWVCFKSCWYADRVRF